MPLALALAGTRVTLVERSARRAAFLKHVRRELALAPEELTVVDRPLADAALAPVDVVTWRAVAPLARLLPGLLPVLHTRSTLALYQGTAATVQRELAVARQAAGERLQARVVALKVPHMDAERHLVLLRGLVRSSRPAGDGRASVSSSSMSRSERTDSTYDQLPAGPGAWRPAGHGQVR